MKFQLTWQQFKINDDKSLGNKVNTRIFQHKYVYCMFTFPNDSTVSHHC